MRGPPGGAGRERGRPDHRGRSVGRVRPDAPLDPEEDPGRTEAATRGQLRRGERGGVLRATTSDKKVLATTSKTSSFVLFLEAITRRKK